MVHLYLYNKEMLKTREAQAQAIRGSKTEEGEEELQKSPKVTFIAFYKGVGFLSYYGAHWSQSFLLMFTISPFS